MEDMVGNGDGEWGHKIWVMGMPPDIDGDAMEDRVGVVDVCCGG
jgi:hypothetical protein